MPPRDPAIWPGLYASGRPYLSVWTLLAGYPRCVAPPLAIDGGDPATLADTIAGAIAVNGVVADLAARAGAVEAAARLAAQDPPPSMIATPDLAGQMQETPNPAHAAWTAAVALVADAAGDDALQQLLRTRALALALDAWGQPAEPPYALDLPPVPALDALAETADWDGEGWIVRTLTGPERAAWPIRPPPVPARVSRTQLRLTLAAGGVLDMVDAAIAGSGDAELIERWAATDMERASPHLIALAGSLLGLDAAGIDDFFRAAAAR
jgi:hypothetical protein